MRHAARAKDLGRARRPTAQRPRTWGTVNGYSTEMSHDQLGRTNLRAALGPGAAPARTAVQQFAQQLAGLGLGRLERPPPGGGGTVHAPHVGADPRRRRPQIATPLQSMQQRVDSAGAELVAAAPQVFNDAQTKNRSSGGVLQNE